MPNPERRTSKKIEKSPEKRNRKLLALAAGLSASIAALVAGERIMHHRGQDASEPTPLTAEPDKEDLREAARKAEALRKILEAAAVSTPEAPEAHPEKTMDFSKMGIDSELLKQFPGKDIEPSPKDAEGRFMVNPDNMNWKQLEKDPELKDKYFKAVEDLDFTYTDDGQKLTITLPDEPTFELSFWVDEEEVGGEAVYSVKYDRGSGEVFTYLRETTTDPDGFDPERISDITRQQVQRALLNHFKYGRPEGFDPDEHIIK
ncbi:hypothetical protein KKC88_03470 [Patescibacteria group bacterium]|nr:hypothetical protein [Patescibacteria group bacterium]MBU1673568.1 hypothetical protein [Patescibacteria group bacterium]MBU1963646.1 hypothetical protein [Patescibacteria group bacterium]